MFIPWTETETERVRESESPEAERQSPARESLTTAEIRESRSEVVELDERGR